MEKKVLIMPTLVIIFVEKTKYRMLTWLHSYDKLTMCYTTTKNFIKIKFDVLFMTNI